MAGQARELEPAVRNLVKQAWAVDLLTDGLMDELMASKAIPQEDVEAYLFAVDQLRDMTTDLKRSFYAALWPNEAAASH